MPRSAPCRSRWGADIPPPRVAIPEQLSPAAFHRRRAGAPITALAGATMGTSWSVQAVDAPASLRGEVEHVLDDILAQMSHWEPTSALSRFNEAPPGRWQPLPAGFAQVLTAAMQMAEASGGAFDPAMGHLADLWGFGPAGRGAFPSEKAIADALARSGWRWIERDGARARRLAPAALDFSGIAKGHAVDAVAARLLELGLADFLVEIGGELRGEGVRPDGQPWWVDLETPDGMAAAPLRIALHGLSVATSGDYQRGFDHAGRRFSHTIDPRTGWPIDNGVVSVSVLHSSCTLADAWATTLTVLGPSGMDLAERLHLSVRMLVRDRELISPALAAMLD